MPCTLCWWCALSARMLILTPTHVSQKELHNDSVQSMEYTITTPLFSAILLASVSSTVPTGMVQWLFTCLLVSHILCIPILFLSHLSVKYKDFEYTYFHGSAINTSVGLLLVACVMLQVNALTIKLLYITTSWDYYTVDGLLKGSVGFMVALQILFVLTVLLVVVSGMWAAPKSTFFSNVANVSSMTYTVINLIIKFVIGAMVASAAMNKGFPVFSCDIWEGKYATPLPPVV